MKALLLALLAAASISGEPAPRAGEQVYLMVLSDRAAEPDVVSLGGRILQWWSDRRLIAIPHDSVDELRNHDGVAYLQRVWTDENRTADPMPRLQSHSGMVPNAVPPPWTTGTFLYDGSGNIKKAGDDEFGYDRVGRITTATIKDQTQSFSYDAYGNLNQLGPQTLNADPATNRLLTEHIASQTPRSYDYDAVGNITRDADNRKYHYDPLGMVTAIDLAPTDWGDGDMRMIYTADDERIMVAGLTTTRYRVRDLGARVLREWKSTNNFPEWERDYIYAGGALIAGEVQIDQRQNGQRHYHTDHLGSTRLVTDGAGELVSQHDYLAFGAEVLPTNTEFTNTKRGPRDPKKFTGHERDYFSMADVDGDAVDYMHARFYTPEWGRFLTTDPGRDWDPSVPQSWNLYSYVRNDPFNDVDPNGRGIASKSEADYNNCLTGGPCDPGVAKIEIGTEAKIKANEAVEVKYERKIVLDAAKMEVRLASGLGVTVAGQQLIKATPETVLINKKGEILPRDPLLKVESAVGKAEGNLDGAKGDPGLVLKAGDWGVTLSASEVSVKYKLPLPFFASATVGFNPAAVMGLGTRALHKAERQLWQQFTPRRRCPTCTF